MGRDEHDCPVCGQPVTTVVRRYKTLGAWVPKWVAGPCRNTACEAYVDPAAEAEDGSGEAARSPRPEPKERS
ncbi:hypothetical protein ACKI1I_22640 [Streptomyces turgidiscabies]|uniref:hypothetical protein n=1 Tax=Streptomyces TaxID=1883 RepID=UPI0005C8B7F1|nr:MULTISPECIES: hypothetical protein [Streptomyces]MDX3495474.1 hypothetical protein [Streptomyces turgidiscabies]GAQ70161.1 hypothetical protein T45_01895 [Streptomyces turgidiscabies]